MIYSKSISVEVVVGNVEVVVNGYVVRLVDGLIVVVVVLVVVVRTVVVLVVVNLISIFTYR